MNTKTIEGLKSIGVKNIFYGALIFVLILSLSGSASAAASIWTDKADYSPGETVLISGNGFAANTNLTQINILRPDGALDVCPLIERCGTLPTTDASGSFLNYEYTLDGIEGTYNVTASDGANTAKTNFTDWRYIKSVTLDGKSNVIVAPGATVTVSITVKTGTVFGLGNNDWKSTGYKIGGQAWQCNNTPDHTNSGTYTETFTITAPSTPGFYDVSLRAYANNGCSGDNDSKTLTDGLWVVSCGTPATLLSDGFEGSPWDGNWNDVDSDWYRSGTEHSGGHSAGSYQGHDGFFTSGNLDASGAAAIYVSFWYKLDDTENDDFELYYYDGSNYNFIADLGSGDNDKWLHYTDTITDAKYFKSNFRIQFLTGLEKYCFDYELVWVDDVLIGNSLCHDDNDACTTATCSEVGCAYLPITRCINSDGCCPAGCHKSNDNDCEQNVGVGDNVAGSALNLIDPPLGENVCRGSTTKITANITINATDQYDPLLGNVSLCINVTCPGGYTMNNKQYLNLSGKLTSVFQFTVTPPVVGTCNVTTCIDCDNKINETNENDNCENVSFKVVACGKRVPVSPAVILAVLGIITAIAVSRIRK